AAGAIAGFWVMIAAAIDPIRSWLRPAGTAGITRGALGMSVAHFGIGVFVIGVTIVSAFSVEADRSLRIGDREQVAGYEFELRGLRNTQGPNYQAIEGEVDIFKDGDFVGQLRPQKRTYIVQQSPMTEAGIDAGWNRDLFVALGDPLGPDSWSLRLQYKPLIRLIWLGAFIMALGGAIAASDRRYRLEATAKQKLPTLRGEPA
ncbi:MAG: c-type cytochrome biogenesis protein CcmF, partial [Proteobacteria bacterium]|nr:c-type cytochrome biogenesis protein CcmF [Pseudomonadota bacterium]